MIDRMKYAFIKKVYADHNDSKAIRKTLAGLISGLGPGGLGLNIGAGRTKLDPRVKNLELEPGDGIDYVGSIEDIPCPESHFDLVITQEVLEHVASPRKAMTEIHRVLKPGGHAYIQVPFVIGYHPCPRDFWRFTHEGLMELGKASDFEVVAMDAAVGPATGFYRILVEFWATCFSALHRKLYLPAKFLFAVICYPVKWLDPILRRSPEAMRISGGYFIVCRKR